LDKVTLKVEGMSCGHCVKAIEESVGAITGVSKVKVHLENGISVKGNLTYPR